MATKRYEDLTKQELVRLLEARDRQMATRFGLVWEHNEIERDKALNSDFVALDLDESLSCGPKGPWKNLIIEGDNFDALRYLRMTFAGRVKCIYIDPPYNTGNKDFVYNDHYVNKEDLWRHSTWCEFMYQRLTLAKDLLTQDGTVFVSIDDNEAAALRMMMNRVFAEQNFGATFIWRKVDSPNDNKVSVTPDHEYVVCFSMKPAATTFAQLPAPGILEAYRGPDEQGRLFRDRLLKKNGKNSLRRDRPTMFFGIPDPDGNDVFPIHDNGEEACWAMGQKGVDDHRAAGTLIWKKRERQGKERWEPYTREYAPSVPARPYPTIWNDLPTMRQAKAMLREFFETADLFSTPKPVELIERILRMSRVGPHDLVLDFFAGSGTTAHAVHKLNQEDGGHRRVILVSSTEATAEEPDKNLCRDVCAERVRRVVTGYGTGDAKVEGLRGDFAYLRCRRIPVGELTEIDHAQVWTALQLTHCPMLAHFDEDAKVLTARMGDDAGGVLIYVPHLTAKNTKALLKSVTEARSAIVYTWQPDLAALRLKNEGNVEIQPVPESLARRFGVRL